MATENALCIVNSETFRGSPAPLHRPKRLGRQTLPERITASSLPLPGTPWLATSLLHHPVPSGCPSGLPGSSTGCESPPPGGRAPKGEPCPAGGLAHTYATTPRCHSQGDKGWQACLGPPPASQHPYGHEFKPRLCHFPSTSLLLGLGKHKTPVLGPLNPHGQPGSRLHPGPTLGVRGT